MSAHLFYESLGALVVGTIAGFWGGVAVALLLRKGILEDIRAEKAGDLGE
jgi:hypothetical protein